MVLIISYVGSYSLNQFMILHLNYHKFNLANAVTLRPVDSILYLNKLWIDES